MPNETTAIEMPERKVLLNPGPAATTDSVKLAQLVCDICPREKEFGEVMEQVAADLTKVVHGDGAGYSAVLFCGSGTVCIDASLSSFLPGKGKALIVAPDDIGDMKTLTKDREAIEGLYGKGFGDARAIESFLGL